MACDSTGRSRRPGANSPARQSLCICTSTTGQFVLDIQYADYGNKDPSGPSIILQDGKTISADVVVGADGVHSLAAEAVLQRTVEAIAPVHANTCYRFLIPASVLETDPTTRAWHAETGLLTRVFPDNKTHRRLVSYVCRKYVATLCHNWEMY